MRVYITKVVKVLNALKPFLVYQVMSKCIPILVYHAPILICHTHVVDRIAYTVPIFKQNLYLKINTCIGFMCIINHWYHT